ncbi:MAG: T9SS type A sorting domain-containing protein [Sphingobacteriales bacterium]|nr:MAG: T9SS type A sorting domain-containing protein [Sphingobacteriales bacterium]
MRTLSIVALCMLLTATLHAQVFFPALVSDVYTGKASSLPYAFYGLNGKLLFQAKTATSTDLMISDGTASGTHTISNGFGGRMKSQTTMNGYVYFINEADNFLWVTDGLSTTGTFSISNIKMQNNIFKYKTNLLFGGNKPGETTFLWISDGTASGTHKVKEVATGSNDNVSCFTEIGGKVCFYVESGADRSIWITDGTEAGTIKLKDIWVSDPWPTYDNSIQKVFEPLKMFNGKLYFSGNDDVHGFELWETDGTIAGTKMTADINSGATSSHPYDFIVYKGKLVFLAYNPTGVGLDKGDIWTLSGEDILTKVTSAPLCFFFRFFPFNDKLYTSACGYLYETDGTTAGSRKLTTSIVIHYTIEHNGYLYFEGVDLSDPLQVSHLYRLGSDDNITDLFSLNRNDNGHNKNEYRIRSVGGNLYFDAADPYGPLNEDIELYRLDAFPTSVAAVQKTAGNALYPNPANSTFNIKEGNATTVSVYTLTGQLLLTTHQTRDISIAHLPAGMYMVQLTGSDGRVTTHKLVKE